MSLREALQVKHLLHLSPSPHASPSRLLEGRLRLKSSGVNCLTQIVMYSYRRADVQLKSVPVLRRLRPVRLLRLRPATVEENRVSGQIFSGSFDSISTLMFVQTFLGTYSAPRDFLL